MLRPLNPKASSKSGILIAVALTITMLYFGRQIFIPLALALILSFLLSPLVSFLERGRLGRVAAVVIVLAVGLAITVGIGWAVAGQLLEITGHIRDYKDNLVATVHSLHPLSNGPLGQATATVKELNKELEVPPGQPAHSAARATKPIPVQVTAPPTNFIEDLRSLLGPIAGLLETIGMVIIFAAFMLIKREDLRNRLIRLGGQGQLTVMTQALDDASTRLSRYLFLQFLVNCTYGILFGVGLYFMKVPHALLWGALAALLRLVPYIGTLAATTFPILMALAVFPGWKVAVLIFALFVVLEAVVANVVEPWLYGSGTGISAIAILVAAVFWSILWGPVGLILATPLTVCLVLAGRYVPQLSFLEVLLGDEPVLSPQEHFYQRLLAMDQDEARNIAEAELKDKSLDTLYETVFIPGLRLAEEDRHAEILTDRNVDFISQTTREIIEDLGDRMVRPVTQQVRDGSLERQPSALEIVCIPARDEADELVGMMLAQLLQQAGYKASYLAIGTVDDMLRKVEQGGYRIACVSALPPFAVGQARSLCKRLRAKLPDVAVVVALWQFDGGVPRAQERAGGCADAVATSLSESLLQIRRLATLGMAESPDAQPSAEPDPERDANPGTGTLERKAAS